MLALHFFGFFNWVYSPATSLIGLIGASCQCEGSRANVWSWEKKDGGRTSSWHQRGCSLVDAAGGTAPLKPATQDPVLPQPSLSRPCIVCHGTRACLMVQ